MRVFSHVNSHKGAECHPAIDCPKHLAAVVAIRSFERGGIVGLRGSWIGHIDGLQNVSMVCRCFEQWSMEHSHIRRPGSGRPHSTDARQDRRIVRAVVAV